MPRSDVVDAPLPSPLPPPEPAVNIVSPSPQPNEVDRRRIERQLAVRSRYKYVSPVVRLLDSGYLIESPCCSRRVDPQGGVVDIARIEFLPKRPLPWELYRKDHENGEWRAHGSFGRLTDLLDLLNVDPERLFWQ